ncbi:hypothetical protein [Streptomyces sp. MMG1121]|uniref:hypothetical protein n=1 Tax=Streptomyces sp. MMG1121 TaxID=1415544 RepID=UPI0006AFC209|nr:hypothetical protein [Streptomyces sp. MMG1121]KOV60391.1 hypothetical protein ADK64_31365 [Streptomyces sp. MMG1121]
MKKIIGIAAVALVAAALATSAFAGNDSDFGPGVEAANKWNFSAAAVCFQEPAAVPAASPWTGNPLNHCTHGNVLNPSGHRQGVAARPERLGSRWPCRPGGCGRRPL